MILFVWFWLFGETKASVQMFFSKINLVTDERGEQNRMASLGLNKFHLFHFGSFVFSSFGLFL